MSRGWAAVAAVRGQGGDGGNFADSVVNSALRFRAQAPLIDQLLREIGVQGGDVGQAAQGPAASRSGAGRDELE